METVVQKNVIKEQRDKLRDYTDEIYQKYLYTFDTIQELKKNSLVAGTIDKAIIETVDKIQTISNNFQNISNEFINYIDERIQGVEKIEESASEKYETLKDTSNFGF
ncbi:MAG: hypothetical protein MR598_07450 [Erysipelotrichaceae bacterium]|nr:hypothetical protein [Erysipelotrichaceae bacterium]